MSKEKKVARQQVFRHIDGNKHFWAANGTIIRSMFELAGALEGMDGYTFAQHVNEGKNDFGNWAKDVLQDQELAEKLYSSKDLGDHKTLVLRHIVEKIK